MMKTTKVHTTEIVASTDTVHKKGIITFKHYRSSTREHDRVTISLVHKEGGVKTQQVEFTYADWGPVYDQLAMKFAEVLEQQLNEHPCTPKPPPYSL